MMTDKSVELLPESDDVLVCARYAHVINEEDFNDIFFANVKKNFAKSGRVRALLLFDDSFQGWEKEAAEANFESITQYGIKAEKIAYVNPPQHKILQMKLAEPILQGEVRFFDKSEFDQALAWVRE